MSAFSACNKLEHDVRLCETLQPFTLCSDHPHLLFYSFVFLLTGLVSTCKPGRNVAPHLGLFFLFLLLLSIFFLAEAIHPQRTKASAGQKLHNHARVMPCLRN